MFFIIEKSEETTFEFSQKLWLSYKMGSQKIINFVNDSSNEESKFARKKWYVMDSQTAKGKYDQNNSLKLERESIK